MNKTRIAIQSKGRLSEASIAFLQRSGISFEPNGRNCMTTSDGGTEEILFLRDDDIPEYVARGVVDYGIVGRNVLEEKKAGVKLIKVLGFAKCQLVIAVKNESKITTARDLEGERIATSYPKLLRNFLQENGVNAAIIELQGSVEIAPALNLADAICDLTQTGKTLRENGLKPLISILDSEALLIQSPFTRKKLSV